MSKMNQKLYLSVVGAIVVTLATLLVLIQAEVSLEDINYRGQEFISVTVRR